MSQILIRTAYENGQAYGDRTGQVYGTTYDVVNWYFDTNTRTVTRLVEGQYDNFQDGSPPEPFDFNGEFYFRCQGSTRLGYVHDGVGGFTITSVPNSPSCNYVPPACLLGTVTVTQGGTPAGFTLTASVDGSVAGSLLYALNSGVEQVSATFTSVAPGTHTVRVRDTGLAGCTRSATVIVLPAPALVVPTGAPQGIDFVGQPVWYVPAGVPAGADVVLELWAETEHGAEDFGLVLALRKQANAGGVAFRLDALLWPRLRAVVPPLSQAAAVRCRRVLANYFVRTIVYTAGQLPAYTISPLRTALRGALPAERRDLDYFSYRLDAFGQPPFLSWAPAGRSLTPGQPEWLFWLGGGGLLTVRRSYVRTGFASGAPLVEDETVDLRGGRPGMQLLAIPVRPRAGMDAVSLGVYDELGEALSPLATYALVEASSRSRYLVFTNSLGGFDVLRTEGRLESLLEGTASSVELPAGPGQAAPAAESQTFDVAAGRKLKLATGWLTAAQLRWLQELVLAREIWEWQAGRLLPLIWPKRQLLYQSDDNPLRGLLLEFDYAFAPMAYADLP